MAQNVVIILTFFKQIFFTMNWIFVDYWFQVPYRHSLSEAPNSPKPLELGLGLGFPLQFGSSLTLKLDTGISTAFRDERESVFERRERRSFFCERRFEDRGFHDWRSCCLLLLLLLWVAGIAVIRTKVREGKGREVNLGSSEERVRDPRKEMTIRFVLLVNKQGQTRLAQYYEYLTIDERRALEGEIVRKCLARSENQVSEAKIWFCVVGSSVDRMAL